MADGLHAKDRFMASDLDTNIVTEIPRSELPGNFPNDSISPAGHEVVPQDNTNGSSMTDEEKRKEDKRKERQARIAKWKAQKAKEGKETKETREKSVESPILTDPVLQQQPVLKLAPAKASRALFLGDEDDEETRMQPLAKRHMPRLPVGGADGEPTRGQRQQSSKIAKNSESNDTADSLDEYMAELESTDVTGVQLPELVNRSDSDDATAADDSDKLSPEEVMALLEKKKKKDIPPVNHSIMNYEPFRKNFYVEPQEIGELTETEVDSMRLELDGIKIRGQDCPKPVLKWAQLGLPASVMYVISDVLAYERPSAIQAQGIPAIMSGRDVIGVAKTGSGKTMAFLLPMFRQIKDQRPLSAQEGPIGVIMTPTRELAVQIFRECKPFLKALDLRAVCAYGGAPIKDQIAELKRGAEIVVCTPGRMIDLLTANQGRVTNLSRVTYLVLDEADRMFDMGFEPQVMKIVRNIRPDRQTVLFSATFPRQMEALARKILNKPVEIVVGARSMVAPEITQIVEVVPDNASKFVRTLQLLGQQPSGASTLIFVERQDSADSLFRELMGRGYPSLVIHGAKEQLDRDSAINDFKQGVVSLLIATSVAARGLDVKHLRLVINYDTPNHLEDYVHRVGRTGRAGNTGTAVTFLLPDQERAAFDLAKALKLSKAEVPEDVQKMADEFMEKIKSGKEQYSRKGFKGKGLEKLDLARQQQRALERRAYGEEEEPATEHEEADKTAPGAPSPVADVTEGLFQQAVVVPGTEKPPRVQVGAAPDNKGPDVSAYHAKLEINGFPQKARWQVSSRTNQAKVIEAHGVSLTLKGMYYAPGKSPTEPTDEPKLYLLIEGPSESAVLSAYQQLQSLLVGGIEQSAQTRPGRYTV